MGTDPKTGMGTDPKTGMGTDPKNGTGTDPKNGTGADPKNGRAPTQRPATAIHHRRREGVRWFLKRPTSQGPSEETTGRRSPSSGPTLEKWGDVWTSRLNRG